MYELIAKYLSDNATVMERNEVEQWRSESEENAQEFFDIKKTWLLAESFPVQQEIVLENRKAKVVGWPSYLKYAAAIVLLAMIGTLWYLQPNQEEQVLEVFAGVSETLQDGTTVSLKNGAKILSSSFTKEERVVEISGKAFFEVTHNPDKPFYVMTEFAKVKVLGTSFLVNSEGSFTEVCVESGLVEISNESNMSMNLEKGEMGMIKKDNNGIIKRQIEDENFLSWKNGVMAFERSSTSEVIRILEDTYETEFVLPENLEKCQLTAKFNKKSLEEVIQILAATFNWEYKILKDKVVLSGEGC